MRRINPVLWNIVRVVLPPLFRVTVRWRREGVENIPSSGAVLFVANHVSNADPPLLGAAALPRRVYFMAKRELFRNRVAAYLLGAVGAFPVDRGGADRTAFRTAREVLASGECLLMFPEGTRSADGRPGPAWPGAGALGLEPGVTVVPVAIWGSQRRWGPVRVRVGAPIGFDGIPDAPRAARSQAAADRMMEAVSRLLHEMGAWEEVPA